MKSKRIRWMAILSAGLAVGAIHCTASEASAQGFRRGESRRFTPSRPTFGDAFNYARDDVGLLTDYHTFVMPQRQLRSTLQQQERTIVAQQDEISGLETDLSKALEGVSPTGKGGSFMNFSNFYNFSSSPRRRR